MNQKANHRALSRTYDATTGKLAWAWDLGKANPTALLKAGENYTRGTPNAWGTYNRR